MGKVSFPLHNVRKDILNNWHLEHISEDITVPEEADEYGFFTISLTEIPDSSSGVKISGLTEFRSSPYDSKSKKYVLPSNSFWVNYFNGTILFHRSQAGNSFVVEYDGKGSLVEADDVNDLDERVNTNISNIGELQTTVENFQQAIEKVDELNGTVESLSGNVSTISEGLNTVNTALDTKVNTSDLETAIDETRSIIEGYVAAGGEVEQIVDSKLLDYTPAAEFTPVKTTVESNSESITDLTSRVETIENANYVTEDALSNLASEEFVTEKISEIEIPDVSNLATKDEIPDVSNLASETFVTEKISEIEIPDVSNLATKDEIPDVSNFVTSSDVDTAIENADHVKSSELSGLVAVNNVNVSSAQHKIITTKNNKNLTALLFNESDGGGSQFKNEDAGKISFIGVNNGADSNEIWVQGYAKNISTNIGTRLTLTTDGMYYTKNQANGSYTANDEILVKSDVETSLEPVNEKLDAAYDTSTVVEVLLNKINILEKKLAETRNKSNVVPETIVSGTSVYNDSTADMVFNGGDTVSEKTTVTAKSVEVQEMAAENASISFKATDGDVTISNFENSGTLPRSQSNAQVSINTDEYVNISNCTFGENGYNSVEIGLSNTSPKSVTIDNCNFNGTLSNNAILIFSHADDAIITISNCVFENVSNALRISNRTNTKGVFTFVNCTFNKWETGTAYAGPILCQDYTNTTAEAYAEANLFAPEKIKINFVNCIGPDGKKIDGDSDPATYSASGDDNQLVYIYGMNSVLPYDSTRYPEISFK